jgi:hypothetical protein
MSYDNSVSLNDYVSGYLNRGQFLELGNLRIWNSPAGTFTAPRLSTVSGTDNCWHTGRQCFYNSNYGCYVTYISPITTTPKPFNAGEIYSYLGDTQEVLFTNGSSSHRVIFNVSSNHEGSFLSLERLSTNKLAGSLGVQKTSGWVANNQDFTVGNLRFRVGNSNMLQVSHLNNSVRLIGQINVGYANGIQTARVDITTTTTPVYMGNAGWYVTGSAQAGASMVADFMDWTNNVKYKVTQILFSSNGNISLNYHFICVEIY